MPRLGDLLEQLAFSFERPLQKQDLIPVAGPDLVVPAVASHVKDGLHLLDRLLNETGRVGVLLDALRCREPTAEEEPDGVAFSVIFWVSG